MNNNYYTIESTPELQGTAYSLWQPEGSTNRKIQVDLTLNKNVDAKVLQLKVFDASDELNPLIKENVTNNTLIENDFDF